MPCMAYSFVLLLAVSTLLLGCIDAIDTDAHHGAPDDQHRIHETMEIGGMTYHKFVERFGERMEASPRQWPDPRAVFRELDEDLDGMLSDREIQEFS
jgi:hypothetical protein|eukprot:SAG25_NODE_192_length_12211_cov_44.011394_13_plen_97_part_00